MFRKLKIIAGLTVVGTAGYYAVRSYSRSNGSLGEFAGHFVQAIRHDLAKIRKSVVREVKKGEVKSLVTKSPRSKRSHAKTTSHSTHAN